MNEKIQLTYLCCNLVFGKSGGTIVFFYRGLNFIESEMKFQINILQWHSFDHNLMQAGIALIALIALMHDARWYACAIEKIT